MDPGLLSIRLMNVGFVEKHKRKQEKSFFLQGKSQK